MELSHDGRFAAFVSDNNHLAANDQNGLTLDIFLRDNLTRSLTLISRNTNGMSANGHSHAPGFSRDATKLFFESEATDLVANETASLSTLYECDLATLAITRLLSNVPGRIGSYQVTPDGRHILFEAAEQLSPLDTNIWLDLYLHDRVSGTNHLVSANFDNTAAIGAANTYWPPGPFDGAISDDGRFVAFHSTARFVSSPQQLSTARNLYWRDIQASTNRLISSLSGELSPSYDSTLLALSGTGRFAVFVNEYNRFALFDAHSINQTNRTSLNGSRLPIPDVAIFSEDESRILFNEGRSSLEPAVTGRNLYTRNLPVGTNRLVTAKSGSVSNLITGPFDVSANLQTLLLTAHATNGLTEGPTEGDAIYALDLETGNAKWLGSSEADSARPQDLAISGDGRTMAFSAKLSSALTRLPESATEVFVGPTSGTNAAVWGSAPITTIRSATANAGSWLRNGSLSADGRWLAFQSNASDLVSDDFNQTTDVFLADLKANTIRRVSLTTNGLERARPSSLLGMSSDGRLVAYWSREYDKTNQLCVYFADRQAMEVVNLRPDGSIVQHASRASLAAEGGRIAYADGLGQTWIRDLETGETAVVSAGSERLAFSPDGRHLATSNGRFILADNGAWQRIAAFAAVSHFDERSFSDDSRSLISIDPKNGRLFLTQLNSTNDSVLLATNVTRASISGDASVLYHEIRSETEDGAVRRQLRALRLGSGEQTEIAAADELKLRIVDGAAVSSDGRFVMLESASAVRDGRHSNLYRYDTLLDSALRVSRTEAAAEEGNGPAGMVCISADARTIVFSTMASDLVANDFNCVPDLFVVIVPPVDADGNGIEDGWQKLHPTIGDAGGDPDQDGMPNLFEFRAGTDPLSAQSVFAVKLQSNVATLKFECRTVRGKHYVIESAFKLPDGEWLPASPEFLALSSETTVAIAKVSESGSNRFFRLRLLED